MNFRFLFAQISCKFVGFILRNIFKRGTNKPGSIALKICPDALRYYKMPQTVICVTGTNGKTSCSNMLTHILRESGKTVVNNSEGSNMASGLVSLFLFNSSISGKVSADIAVLEIDERSSKYIYSKITPTYVLCTNLFRDSIKRNGHSEFIFEKINDYLPKSTTMVLNANDPISGLLGKNNGNNTAYFSVCQTEKSYQTSINQVRDIIACPVCHKALNYDYYHNNHIGQASCECGFSVVPKEFMGDKFFASDVDFSKKTFEFNDKKGSVQLNFDGNLFNVFNITAVSSVYSLLGLDTSKLPNMIKSFTQNQGRFVLDTKDDFSVFSMLSKNQNPISASQSISFLNTINGTKSVVLCITDPKDEHGHEDISWLYDVDFSALCSDDIHKIIIAGTRCYDVALCLYLRGVSPEIIKLYEKYDDMKANINSDIEKTGTIGIYFALYAKSIGNDIKKILLEEKSHE